MSWRFVVAVILLSLPGYYTLSRYERSRTNSQPEANSINDDFSIDKVAEAISKGNDIQHDRKQEPSLANSKTKWQESASKPSKPVFVKSTKTIKSSEISRITPYTLKQMLRTLRFEPKTSLKTTKKAPQILGKVLESTTQQTTKATELTTEPTKTTETAQHPTKAPELTTEPTKTTETAQHPTKAPENPVKETILSQQPTKSPEPTQQSTESLQQPTMTEGSSKTKETAITTTAVTTTGSTTTTTIESSKKTSTEKPSEPLKASNTGVGNALDADPVEGQGESKHKNVTTTPSSKTGPTPQPIHQNAPNKKKDGTVVAMSMTDFYYVAVVAGCSVAGVIGIVVAGVCWYKLQKRAKLASDVEYPAYGITGPNKDRAPTTGDRKLAQSAQMYHYQHQKQQMIAMEKANGEMKHDASEDDSEEENDEGDYTVYECPGLAPTGEMEVKNPLFNDETPSTGGGGKDQDDK